MVFVKHTRQAWIDVATKVLAESGPDGVGIEALSRRLGVTKGGFYGYFANRHELLDAVLDDWEAAATSAVADRVERADLDPGSAAFLAAQLTWSADGLLDLDLAIREWARRDPDVAARLARVDAYRLEYLRDRMVSLSADEREAEARTVLAYAAAIGMLYAAGNLDALRRGRQDAIELLTTPGTIRGSWQDTTDR